MRRSTMALSNPTLSFLWWFRLSHLQAFDRQRARLQVRPHSRRSCVRSTGRARKAAAT